jgi:hypothetical protein
MYERDGKNAKLKALFASEATSNSSSKVRFPEEACYLIGEAAFDKAVVTALKIKSKQSKKTKLKKLAKAILKARKAYKAKKKLDMAGDKIKESDIIDQWSKMPNCNALF